MNEEWMTSEYFVPETDNWHMKDDAPEYLKRQFEEWMKEHEGTDDLIVD